MNTSTNVPEAFIAIGRNRLKIYNGKNVFVKDGEEFQIELFNPTTKTIGAKIFINGNSISNSLLILKPGERSYLERYLDDNKKFLFETYEVEDSKAVKAAIKENGIIKVEFFNEKAPASRFCGSSTGTTTFTPWHTTTISAPNVFPGNPNIYCTTSTNTISNGITSTNSGCVTDMFYSSSNTAGLSGATGIAGPSGYVGVAFVSPGVFTQELDRTETKTLETGRIEKGSNSSQSFSNYYGEFELFSFAYVDYKLMPESQKPIEVKDIRQYCGSCRNRIKKASWKFCPSCGESLD